MRHKEYEEIIDRLRTIKPVAVSEVKLTDGILNSIQHVSPQRKLFIRLRVSEYQWTLINRARTLMTTAAIVLVVFFILQEREINIKLSRLEHDVAIEKYFDRNDGGSETRMLKAYYLLSTDPVLMSGDSIQQDLLRIHRKSLNYLLQKIKDLEKENISYRERVRQQYLETTSEKH